MTVQETLQKMSPEMRLKTKAGLLRVPKKERPKVLLMAMKMASRLRAKRTQKFGKNFRATFTPEQEQKIIPVLTRLFDAAFRKGYYKFKDAARFVLNSIRSKLGGDVADQITLDHLQGAYIGMAGKYKDQGADAPRTVVAVENKEELENADEPDQRGSTDLERDSQDAEAGDGVGAEGVRAGRAGDGGAGGRGIQGAEAEGGAGSGSVVSGRETAAAGERGDQSICTGAPESS